MLYFKVGRRNSMESEVLMFTSKQSFINFSNSRLDRMVKRESINDICCDLEDCLGDKDGSVYIKRIPYREARG
jgi:hypothetical protein